MYVKMLPSAPARLQRENAKTGARELPRLASESAGSAGAIRASDGGVRVNATRAGGGDDRRPHLPDDRPRVRQVVTVRGNVRVASEVVFG